MAASPKAANGDPVEEPAEEPAEHSGSAARKAAGEEKSKPKKARPTVSKQGTGKRDMKVSVWVDLSLSLMLLSAPS